MACKEKNTREQNKERVTYYYISKLVYKNGAHKTNNKKLVNKTLLASISDEQCRHLQ